MWIQGSLIWLKTEQNVLALSFKCQYVPIIVPVSAVHVVPTTTTRGRSGEWYKTWCALFARSQSTWNHMYILYRTESLGPEKGLVKGGPGPSCTENRQRKDSHDTSFSSGGGNVQTTGIISQNSKGIPDTRSRSYLETECSTYVLMHEKKWWWES